MGGQEEFDSVFSIYQQSANPDQKLHALRALGATQDPKVIQQALSLVFDQANVRPQDIGYILGNVEANPAGRRAAWAFVKGNWSRFYDAFYRGSISLLSRVVSSTTEHFTALADAQDVRAFFADGKDVSSITRAIDQSCEKIECAAQVLQRDSAAVAAWLIAQEKAE
jgi:aminopeptidase 2